MKSDVISGLKWILDGDRFGFGMGWTEDSEPRDDHELAGYYIQRAIDLLKEQEPVQPVPCADKMWICSNCFTPVKFDGLQECGIVNIEHKFCPECGHRIKWEVDDADFE